MQYPGKGIMYPGAQGNIRFAGKRFWTDHLYSSLCEEDEQAGWIKEEPPSFMAGSVRTALQSQERAKVAGLGQELSVLTPREVEVLTLVAEGRTNQEIADQLVLSVKTVQAHRANVMEKLGLHDITHLVRFALRYGLIPPEP